MEWWMYAAAIAAAAFLAGSPSPAQAETCRAAVSAQARDQAPAPREVKEPAKQEAKKTEERRGMLERSRERRLERLKERVERLGLKVAK